MLQNRITNLQGFIALILVTLFTCTSQESHSQDIKFNDLSKESTLDVVTWNIEWFGDEENGPEDLDLQMNNVIKVVQTIDADLYALQEISNKPRFFAMIDSLEDYHGFLANYNQTLNTAYIFKPGVIDSLDSGFLVEQQNKNDWANGRFPLFFEFDATIGEKKLRIFSYNLHAKAQADQYSYNQRVDAASSLKQYLDEFRFNASVIILGDFNDQLTVSTFQEKPSPYEPITSDIDYFPVTLSLEENGAFSYLPGEYHSMIDHIITTNVLTEIQINGSQKVDNPEYIEDFITTTSDHAPVWTRFNFTNDFEDPYKELPETFSVAQNYPNPFNPSTTIRFSLDEAANVTIKVFDILGREITILSDDKEYLPGKHEIPFQSEGLPSGIYLYRVELASGISKTRKMLLIK